MTYLFFWVAFSIAVGLFASTRGRGSGNWFVVSLLISPLLGFIFCALSSDLTKEAEKKALLDAQPSLKTHVKCPKCAEFVRPEASVCIHCGGELTPDTGFANRAALKAKQAEEETRKNTILGWSIIIGVGLIILAIAK